MNRRSALLFLSVLSLFLSACVAGNTHSFNYAPAAQSDVGNGRVVLLFAVDDQREYVVSKDEPVTFVGEQRNGYGMPFNVTTADGRPFATVVQETVRRDLEASGFKVTPSQEKPTSVASAVKAANAQRALAIVMREFKSDTMNNINVEWDFDAIVYDQDGRELLRSNLKGDEVLDGSFMNPVKSAKQKVPPFFYAKIHQLLNDPGVMRALSR